VRILFIGEVTRQTFGGWFRTVECGGKRYRVGISRGHGPIRIAFSNKRGWRWNGWVTELGCATGVKPLTWNGDVPKSTGARGLLRRAKVWRPEPASAPADLMS
jgi:hypothetical protein